jgi:hypothetical protein
VKMDDTSQAVLTRRELEASLADSRAA